MKLDEFLSANSCDIGEIDYFHVETESRGFGTAGSLCYVVYCRTYDGKDHYVHQARNSLNANMVAASLRTELDQYRQAIDNIQTDIAGFAPEEQSPRPALPYDAWGSF